MILPTKYLTPAQSLLGVAARLLARLDKPKTVNQLWEETRGDSEVATFERFVLALDVLFIIGAVDLRDGRLRVGS